jgi:hypothetical protein
MKELFEKQLNGTQPLTKDVLEKLQVKTYFNGEEKMTTNGHRYIQFFLN